MSAERTPPRLIPVLDVMNGVVVHAVGGRREEYRPLVSTLTASTDPLEVAVALLAATGSGSLYVADLDAITGADRSGRLAARLAGLRCRLYLDAGIRTAADCRAVPHVLPVFGLETFTESDVPITMTRDKVFSLDLRDGELMGDWARWGAQHSRDALGVARSAVARGFAELIVLDVARVGTGTGTGTESLLRAIRAAFPSLPLIAGGGVRTWADVERLGEAGATGVLVASALHDGTLTARSEAP